MHVEWTTYGSPVGALTRGRVRGRPAGGRVPPPRHLGQVGGAPALGHSRAAHRPGPLPHHQRLARRLLRRIGAPVPFPDHLKHWFELSPAQVAVFKTLRRIPLGETRSYEDVARATRLHPRQIGWLVAANHLAILIPCHRVVGKDGSLVGYGGGLAKKRWLLDHELRTAGVVLSGCRSADRGPAKAGWPEPIRSGPVTVPLPY